MEKSQEILSDIIVHTKYSKYLPEQKRRETWGELVTRNKEMHIKKFPKLALEIEEAYKYVYSKKILPSMRSLQFGGKAIEITPSRIYNCAYLPVDHYKAFSETMFLLLGGTGVGYSVQKHHIEKLPEINKPTQDDRSKRYLVGDSIEGWSDAIKVLMKSYFSGGPRLRFDFSDIRPKGAELVTSGGKAPGPQPLKECLVKIKGILDNKENGSKLTPLEAHDIQCHIADAVLAGGIRRAAMISLFSKDDMDMTTCKSGSWWELNPQRGRANNSVVLKRGEVDKKEFMSIWQRIKDSYSGEPGIYWTNDLDWGTNPCCEIALRPFQFCNLIEINASDIESQEDLNARAKAAAFIGTLQASYTDFHYLRSVWQSTTEKDALLGVSMTGIASMNVFEYNIEKAVEIVKNENKRIAELIGINESARTTCVKPAGTTSLVLGTSSGIHAWHNNYYIRTIRIGKNEAIHKYLEQTIPELLEDCNEKPHIQSVLSIPQKAPEGAVTRTENVLSLLERIKTITSQWVKPGHENGKNTHNVSATVNIDYNKLYAKKDVIIGSKTIPVWYRVTKEYIDFFNIESYDEWDVVAEWMWENRDVYNGLSVLPYDGGTYKQAPFQDCTEEEYNRLNKYLKSIDLTKVIEEQDETDLKGELACSGGACDII